MDSLLQDLHYALRTLKRSPAFALAVIVTLALGIGANTAIFSVVDGVLLRAAPMRDMDRLVMVWETDRKSGTVREPSSIPDFADFRERSTRFERIAAFAPAEVNLTREGSDPSRLAAVAMTHDFLPMVGIEPAVGRGFTAGEDAPGAPRVALISDALWARHFDRNRDAIGSLIQVNDNAWTVIGVMPPGADFGMLQVLGAADYGRGFADRGGRPSVDIWVPARTDPATASRGNHPIIVVAKLRAGATIDAAQLDMARITADLEQEYPQSNDARGAHIEALGQVVFGPVRPALMVLLGAVVLVLLVACANVANLLLVRGDARTRELSVRLALGATPRRLARQFLAESAVLTVSGAVLGVLTASFGLDLLVRLAPATLPRVDSVGIDLRVLGATLAMSLIVGLAFGILPARQARRREAALREASAAPGVEHRRFRSALVVTELSLAVMLMVGAGLLIRSLWQLQGVNPGFSAQGVLKGEFQLPASRYPRDFSVYPRWIETARFTDELRSRLAAMPGVEAVTIAGAHPLDAGFTSSIVVVGREAEAGDWPEPSIRQVDPGYLATLRVPLLAGRGFASSDDAGAPPVMVINEAARRRFFGERDPLGQQIQLWGRARTIVGVIAGERLHGLAEETPPAVYMPLAQAPAGGGSVLVRTSGDPALLAPALRRTVRELDAALPLFGVEPLARTLTDSVGQRRFTMLVLGAFAAVALILAIIGVHGVLSYAVSRRTREIGIRMALGAEARSVVSLVVSQGAALAALGLGLGLAGALAGARLLTRLLYGVGPADPFTFIGVALLLGTAALAASWLPARRAAKVDPMIAIRSE